MLLIKSGLLIVFVLMMSPNVFSDDMVFLREDFTSLADWKPLYFPKIEKHTEYSIERDGENSYLRTESNGSASGLIFKKEFNVKDYPLMRWRWKVSNVFKKGDALRKSGDDYPIRIYINFEYDPDKASFSKRIKYGIAKALYGEYPPDSSLNYIWANREHKDKVIVNPYASEALMIPLRSGLSDVGKWVEEDVNVLEDYRRAFGKEPPERASIAIMNDSDNTGESALSWVDYIEVFRNR